MINWTPRVVSVLLSYPFTANFDSERIVRFPLPHGVLIRASVVILRHITPYMPLVKSARRTTCVTRASDCYRRSCCQITLAY